MSNLDFYLKDDGRVEYSKDLAITQYSNKVDTIRLLTKKTYDVVNMTVTLPNNLQTTKKLLVLQPLKYEEYWVYSYPVDLSMTDFEIQGEKAILKLGFFLYPNIDDQSAVRTTGICFIPVIRNTEAAKPDGSITESDLNILTNKINDINEKLENLGVGEIDTAKNYNTEKGTIKEKFDLVDSQLGNLRTDVDILEQTVDALGDIGSIGDGLTSINSRLSDLEAANVSITADVQENKTDISTLKSQVSTLSGLPPRVSTLESNVASNTSDIANLKTKTSAIDTLTTRLSTAEGNINQNKTDIAEIKNDILPTLQAGLKYEIVDALPNSPSSGVVYLVKNKEEGTNIYVEYLYINNKWEILGSTDGNIDLSSYYTKYEIEDKLRAYYTETEIDTLLNGYYNESKLNTKLSGYYTKTEVDNSLDNYYTKTESNSRFAKATDLDNYYTKTSSDNRFALKTAIPTKVSQLENDSNYLTEQDIRGKADKADVYTKVEADEKFIDNSELTDKLSTYATKTEVSTSDSALSTRIDSTDSRLDSTVQTLDSVGSRLDNAITELERVAVLADSKQLSVVFDTKADMIAYLQNSANTPKIGTELLIKDKDVPDYWVVGPVVNAPGTYTTKYGEVFENVYYGVEESEAKLDLTPYATTESVSSSLGNLETSIKSYVDTQDAFKVDLSAKSSVIGDGSTDTQWASALAVKTYVDNAKAGLQASIDDNSNSIEALQTNLSSTNATLESYKSALDAKDTELEGRLDDHDSAISNIISTTYTKTEIDSKEAAINGNIASLTSGLSTEIENRTAADTQLQTNITAVYDSLNTYKTEHKAAFDAYKAEADNKFLEYSETISKAESVVDYVNTSKALRFSTDSNTTDFTISNVDMSALQAVMSMFGPNEYN